MTEKEFEKWQKVRKKGLKSFVRKIVLFHFGFSVFLILGAILFFNVVGRSNTAQYRLILTLLIFSPFFILFIVGLQNPNRVWEEQEKEYSEKLSEMNFRKDNVD